MEQYLTLLKDEAIRLLIAENVRTQWAKFSDLNQEILRYARRCGKAMVVAYLYYLLPAGRKQEDCRAVLDQWVQDVLDGKALTALDAFDLLSTLYVQKGE